MWLVLKCCFVPFSRLIYWKQFYCNSYKWEKFCFSGMHTRSKLKIKGNWNANLTLLMKSGYLKKLYVRKIKIKIFFFMNLVGLELSCTFVLKSNVNSIQLIRSFTMATVNDFIN